MCQRLLMLLSVVLMSCAAMAQNVMTPADGVYQYDSTAPAGSLSNPIVGGAGSGTGSVCAKGEALSALRLWKSILISFAN